MQSIKVSKKALRRCGGTEAWIRRFTRGDSWFGRQTCKAVSKAFQVGAWISSYAVVLTALVKEKNTWNEKGRIH